MKNIIKIGIASFLFFQVAGAQAPVVAPVKKTVVETPELVVPDEINWTERFILSEQKELRVDIEKLRRELMSDIQQRELGLVDKALSYSANTLNFFFIFLSVILMGLGIIGWKTISATKKSIQNNMEKEVNKIIRGFEAKIEKLEVQQQANILWRQFYSSEGFNEKLEILKKLDLLTPNSRVLKIEKTNVYVEMEAFEKVIEICDEVLSEHYDSPQALFNRAVAMASTGMTKEARDNFQHLVKISPDYLETIEEDSVLYPIAQEISAG